MPHMPFELRWDSLGAVEGKGHRQPLGFIEQEVRKGFQTGETPNAPEEAH